MRFDFVPFFNPGENIPWNRVVKMMREQTQLAEQADFTTVWLTEHHFAHNGYLNAPPNPIMMSLDLASHSEKIRVGQAPIVLPDWHPLRVAEDVSQYCHSNISMYICSVNVDNSVIVNNY